MLLHETVLAETANSIDPTAVSQCSLEANLKDFGSKSRKEAVLHLHEVKYTISKLNYYL